MLLLHFLAMPNKVFISQIKSIQKARIMGVEGNKGGQSFGRGSTTAIAAFARTATHVFRMVMLEACGVNPENWPTGGEHAGFSKEYWRVASVRGY